jgi:DNA-binding response OmpR family regulator
MKGVSVTAVGTGKEAMDLAQTKQFSAVILDLTLAGENGLDLLQRFKEKHPGVPVIMFTALAGDTEKMNEATARGASGYFCKGESLGTLLNGVLRLMRPKPA